MLGLIVFVASFLSLCIGTLIFPSLPPGSVVIGFFENTETTILIAGISGDLLISAMINGLFWSLIITLVYLFWRGPDKRKTDMPVWVPGYAKSHNSKDSNSS
jgi:hypothetical protein